MADLRIADQLDGVVNTGVRSHQETFAMQPQRTAYGRDGMDTAFPSGTQGPARTLRPSRTDRHQCARVEFRHVHLMNGGPK